MKKILSAREIILALAVLLFLLFLTLGSGTVYNRGTGPDPGVVHGTVHDNESGLDIYSRAGSSGSGDEVLGNIPDAGICVVYPEEHSGGWVRVEYRGTQGYVRSDRLVLGTSHEPVHHEAELGSCMKAGSIEYWQCEGCGQRYRDPEGTEYVSESEIKMCEMGHGGLF